MTYFTDDYRTDLTDYDYCGDDYDEPWVDPFEGEPDCIIRLETGM